MPWSEVSVRDQRIAFLRAARAPGAVFRHVCAQFGISRKTGYKWAKRERDAGSVTALADRSRRPHRSPQQLGADVVAAVVAARQATGWGGDKLAIVVGRTGQQAAPRTIDRIIARAGLTRPEAAGRPAVHRFARAMPNELWQVDAKGAYPLPTGGVCHPLSIVDDCSRYAIGLAALPALTGPRVQAVLRRCFEEVGLPDAMLFDHGSPWWNAKNGAGLTHLSVWLLEQDIRLCYSGRRHPQTQGKVERFHRTVGERLRWAGVPAQLRDFRHAFARVQHEYNHTRPHAALDLEVPAARYVPSGRAYQPRPRPWDYEIGLAVTTLDPGGRCRLGGHPVFVSEVLAGKRVALEAWGDRMLIRYRQMYIREVDLRTLESRSLLQPVRSPAGVSPMS